MGEGSRSKKIDLGTYLPLLVSEKKVSYEAPSTKSVALGSGRPSGVRPCSSR